MRSRHLAIGIAACALAGCGAGASQAPKRPALHATVNELEAQTRSDRRKMEALEHELSTLKARLAEAAQDPVPELPVEVLAPEPAADVPGEEYARVVGVDQDGVEILYVGDAARPGSVAPRLRAHAPPRRAHVPPRRAHAPQQTSRTPPPTIDQQMEEVAWDAGDQLPVTGRVGPTVAQHVDREPAARPAPAAPSAMPPPAPRSRAHAHARRPKPRARRPSPPARQLEPAPAAAGDARAAKALYQAHLDTLRAGDHAGASSGFQAFLERFPDHDLADNAQYWLGESMYDQQRYADALAAFRRVVDRYPRGNKVPDALLKIGFCHQALGDAEQARAALARVIDMFPKSHPAALAAERLENIEE